MKKRFLVLFLGVMLVSFEVKPQSPSPDTGFFYPGEVLVYKVKWTFIRIGTITIKTSFHNGNPDYYKVSMHVESNPSIPFLNINEYNETRIDPGTFMSDSYYAFYRNGGDQTKYYLTYNNESRTAEWKVYDVMNRKTLDSVHILNCPRYLDGPSLFFFTRLNSGKSGTINIPTIIEGSVENTRLVFTDNLERIEIDALDYPLDARQYYGFADWEGGSSQSLSGDFCGWISNDNAAIPIYAEVGVLLGKIKIELESWERGGWNKHLKKAGAE